MRHILAFLLVLSIVFSLIGCESTGDSQTSSPDVVGNRVALEHVYTAIPLSIPNGDTANSISPVSSRDMLSLYGRNSGQLTYYDESGAVSSSQILSVDGLAVRQFMPFGEGYAVWGTRTDDPKMYRLAVVEADGSIVVQMDLTDAGLLDVFGAAEESIFYVSASDGTCTVYDDSLNIQKTINMPFHTTGIRIIATAEAENAYFIDSNHALYRYEDGTFFAIYAPDAFANVSRRAYAIPGRGYDFYLYDRDGIYGVTDDVETMLCSFGNSSIVYGGIEELYALTGNAFLAYYQDQFTNTYQYLLLKPSETTVERIVLRMAWLSIGDVALGTMQSIAALFNASGTDYFLEIVNYGKYGFTDTDASAIQRFRKDLLSGAVFDLCAMDTHHCGALYTSMEKNGSFADCGELYANILPSFRAAYQTANGIFGLPYTVNYFFLASPASRGSTLTDIAHEADLARASTDTILCSKGIQYEMAQVFARSLINYETETCDLSSPEFTECLRVLQKVAETCDETRYGGLWTSINANNCELMADKTDYFENVRADKLYYLSYRTTDPGMLAVYKAIYRDIPAKLTGFPTADGGTTLYGEAGVTLCAMANGNSHGALAFLTYYLSDSIQKNGVITETQFPITESAWAAETENRYYSYAALSPTQIRATRRSRTAPKGQNTDTNHPTVALSEEEAKELRELVRNASISTGRDDMVTLIISEELEPFFAGNRSAEDTAEIIQKRAAIYLAE